MTTVYLTVTEVVAIHHDQIKRYGGIAGVRDPRSLRPRSSARKPGYYPDIIAEAAALWESLSQNHPFVDGNKRTAFAVTVTFLAVNGVALDASEEAAMKFLLPLYNRIAIAFDKLDTWLRRNTSSN